jgi:hypothetical protein
VDSHAATSTTAANRLRTFKRILKTPYSDTRYQNTEKRTGRR